MFSRRSPTDGPANGRIQKSTRNPPSRPTRRIIPQAVASASASASANQMHHQAPAHNQGVYHNGAYYHNSYTFPPTPTPTPPRGPTIRINPRALPDNQFAPHGSNGQGIPQYSLQHPPHSEYYLPHPHPQVQAQYQPQLPAVPRPEYYYPSHPHPPFQAQYQPQPQHYPTPLRFQYQPQYYPPPLNLHHHVPTDPRPHTDPTSIFDPMSPLEYHNARGHYYSHPEDLPDRETFLDANQEPKEIQTAFDEGVFFRYRSWRSQDDEDVGPLDLGDGEGDVRRVGQWIVDGGEEQWMEEGSGWRGVGRGDSGTSGGDVWSENGRRDSSVVFLGERRVTPAEDWGMMN